MSFQSVNPLSSSRVKRLVQAIAVFGFAASAIAGCGTQQVSSPSASPLSVATNDVPTIGQQNGLSLIACDDDSAPIVLDRPEIDGHVFVVEACGGTTKALMIEDFILDGSDLTSDGLVSGPDAAVILAGSCLVAGETVTCPVTIADENGDSQGNGSSLTISKMDQGFVWDLAN